MKTNPTKKILGRRSLYVFQTSQDQQAVLGFLSEETLKRQLKRLSNPCVLAENPENGISGYVKDGQNTEGPANWETREDAIEAAQAFAIHWPGIKFSVQLEDLTYRTFVKPTSIFQVLAP